jgi:hypothetical protein
MRTLVFLIVLLSAITAWSATLIKISTVTPELIMRVIKN